MENIFVCDESNDWKLGGFEHSLPTIKVTKAYLEATKEYRAKASCTPEDGNPIGPKQIHARDSYAFAKLVGVLSEKGGNSGGSGGSGGAAAVEQFAARLQKQVLDGQGPAERPTLTRILNDRFFQDSDLVQCRIALEGMMLKRPNEKAQLGSELVRRLRRLKPEVVGRHLSKRLLSRTMLSDPLFTSFYDEFLQPQESSNPGRGILPLGAFREHVIPVLLEFVAERDVAVRVAILRYLPRYYKAIDNEDLVNDVLPELRLGLSDTSDVLAGEAPLGRSLPLPECGLQLARGHGCVAPQLPWCGTVQPNGAHSF